MKPTIITASLGLFFAVAYAAPPSSPQVRLTPNEVDSMQAHDSGAGTSGVSGIRTTVVAGDPCAPQLFGAGADQVDHPRRGPVDS
jgi:hypothetical protein